MTAHRRISDPVEAMAQRVAERAMDLVPGILVQRERRALHDLIAGTAVVHAWDARAARLRFLAREAELAAQPGHASPWRAHPP